MPIKVISQKSTDTYIGTCTNCLSVLEAKEVDLVPATNCISNGGLRWAVCPTCKTTVYFERK